MISIFQKKIFFILILNILVILASSIFWFIYRPTETQMSIPLIPVEEPKEKQFPTSDTSGFKTYRNEEWGFEFQYLGNLILKENTFRSYYSKFNL